MEDPKSAAERLHQALFGKNKEETCTDIIINNDLEHRLLIAKKYGELYGNPLYEDMKSKLGGNYKELCGYCFLTPMEFNAKMLKRGFKGLSVDEQIIFEILADSKDILINFKNEPLYYRSVVYLVLIFIVILFGYYGKMASSSFIYFKY